MASIRSYGWPQPYLSLSKITDEYEEANRILTDSALALMRDGWRWNIDPLAEYPGSPDTGLVLTLASSFAAAFIGTWAAYKVRAKW